jgi:hypothetical protein
MDCDSCHSGSFDDLVGTVLAFVIRWKGSGSGSGSESGTIHFTVVGRSSTEGEVGAQASSGRPALAGSSRFGKKEGRKEGTMDGMMHCIA